MDQAPNAPSPDSMPGTTPSTKGVSPTLPTWDEYYREASRRRRAAGPRNDFRFQKRRRVIRERLAIVCGALLVGALTMAFYLVLR